MVYIHPKKLSATANERFRTPSVSSFQNLRRSLQDELRTLRILISYEESEKGSVTVKELENKYDEYLFLKDLYFDANIHHLLNPSTFGQVENVSEFESIFLKELNRIKEYLAKYEGDMITGIIERIDSQNVDFETLFNLLKEYKNSFPKQKKGYFV